MSAASKGLLELLDRGRDDVEALQQGIAATIAIDALSDRRAVSGVERGRIGDLISRIVERDDIDLRRKALALAAQGRLRLQHGQAELALADLERATLLVDAANGASGDRAFVAGRLGYALSMMARTEQALVAHGASAEHARASGDLRAHVAALQDEGNILQQLGRTREARERFDTSLERARAADDRAGEMRAHAGIAYQHLQALEFEPARDAYASAAAIGEGGVAPRLNALVSGYSALLHLEHGRVDRALALAARAVASSSTPSARTSTTPRTA